jgi:hypothetical protein
MYREIDSVKFVLGLGNLLCLERIAVGKSSLQSMIFYHFSIQITIQAGTRKTAINSLKTIRKNIDKA